MKTAIVWFQQDLRLSDNPSLQAALHDGYAVLPLYILDESTYPLGGATKWWLHHSLKSLKSDLEKMGLALILQKGCALDIILSLAHKMKVSAVFWNRVYEPATLKKCTLIKQKLKEDGIVTQSFNGNFLIDPTQVFNKQGKPFCVFTPFWKTVSLPEFPPAPKPKKAISPKNNPKSDSLESLGLQPKLNWADSFAEYWTPGEDGAQKNLDHFVDKLVSHYKMARDRPDLTGTSRLSPHLHFGEISPLQILQAFRENSLLKTEDGQSYIRELGWREFATYLLFHFPHTPSKALYSKYDAFPWITDKKNLAAWQKGQTGFPIVDAGLRELWTTGWMHNRVRMIVASFLVKNILTDWKEGASWFWDTLVDADLANNTLGWQWSAGCGADAAPYFRIFNPILQGEKFDPNGDYVREWVPEIAKLPNKYLHQPFNAPAEALGDIVLGKTYPKPIVDLKISRDRALAAFKKFRQG